MINFIFSLFSPFFIPNRKPEYWQKAIDQRRSKMSSEQAECTVAVKAETNASPSVR